MFVVWAFLVFVVVVDFLLLVFCLSNPTRTQLSSQEPNASIGVKELMSSFSAGESVLQPEFAANDTPQHIIDLCDRCRHMDPDQRPTFAEIERELLAHADSML